MSISFQHINWLLALALFAAYALIDALYAWYTLSVVSFKAVRSANISALMYFLMAFGVITYVHNYLYIVPVAAGSWVGTFGLVSATKRNKKLKRHLSVRKKTH